MLSGLVCHLRPCVLCVVRWGEWNVERDHDSHETAWHGTLLLRDEPVVQPLSAETSSVALGVVRWYHVRDG